jgi:hypothetical protein
VSIIESFKKIIVFFDDIKSEGIIGDYALIGGLALSAWIRPRTTKDIDLVVVVSERIKWADLASIIEARLHKKVAIHKGTQRTNIKEKLSFVSGQIEVDVINTKGFGLAGEAIKNAVIAEVFGKSVKVVAPEYLILLKLLPLTNQDAIDIKALAKKADMHRLTSLAKRHYLLPKLKSIISGKP